MSSKLKTMQLRENSRITNNNNINNELHGVLFTLNIEYKFSQLVSCSNCMPSIVVVDCINLVQEKWR